MIYREAILTGKSEIRKAQLKDIDIIAEHNILLARETENINLKFDRVSEGVKAVMNDPGKGFYLVVEKEGTVVGQLFITYEWSDWRNKYIWWIQSVYINVNFRGQKIFSLLYNYLRNLARYKKDVAFLRLYVDSSNMRGKKVYESLGLIKSEYEIYQELL